MSQIETRWSLVFQAHSDDGEAGASAQRELMERYAGAVQRYLMCVTRDADAAADLAQEFALRFLKGDFHLADPRRGRFRDYVKRAVLNLVVDAHRRNKSRPQPLPNEGEAIVDRDHDPAVLERQFLDCWRDELLSRAWKRLEELEARGGQPFHTVLRYRAENPELRSRQIAEHLAEGLNRPLTAGWVRQTLRRAREKFVGLVRYEVSLSIGCSSHEALDDEMRDLGLWAYCRPPSVEESGGS